MITTYNNILILEEFTLTLVLLKLFIYLVIKVGLECYNQLLLCLVLILIQTFPRRLIFDSK